MVANGVYSRLSAELKEVEARVNSRLDEINGKLEALMKAGGLSIPPRPTRALADAAKSPRPALNEAK
jgi:hypothetical protein